jgi:hypothetical protein
MTKRQYTIRISTAIAIAILCLATLVGLLSLSASAGGDASDIGGDKATQDILSICHLSPAAQATTPTTVFVYNGIPITDTFNNNAQGYIWQQLGLLDANGRPGTVKGNNVVDGSGNVLGSVITGTGGKIIGYRNAAGTMESYDVSAGATMTQSWNRVASTGTLHIIKHGAYLTGEDGEPRYGGGIQLDNGKTYDGFDIPGGGAGTGAGYWENGASAPNGPYRLPPRPGANITVNVNSCWSSNDPDGEGPQKSVTDSAAGVPGVGATQGHDGKVETRLQIRLSGGTAAQQRAAWRALKAAARAAGFRDSDGNTGFNEVARWLSSLSFQTQYNTAQNAVDQAAPPPGTVRVRVSYSKTEVEKKQAAIANDIGEGGYSVTPYFIYPSPFDVWYFYGDIWPHAWLRVLPGSLTAPTMFHIDQIGVPPAPLPANMVVDSGMMDFKTPGSPPSFSAPLEITLQYYDDSGPLAVYRYDTALGWQQVLTKTVDPVFHTITVDAPSLSVYAVLMQVTPGVEIAPPTAAGSGYPGSVVIYTLTVTNTGDYSDTVTLTARGVWTPTLSTYSVAWLGPGLSESVTVTVVIPLTATHGASDMAVVTATSTISSTMSRVSQVMTTVRWHTIYLPLVMREH